MDHLIGILCESEAETPSEQPDNAEGSVLLLTDEQSSQRPKLAVKIFKHENKNGSGKGYDKCEKDIKKIEKELKSFKSNGADETKEDIEQLKEKIKKIRVGV